VTDLSPTPRSTVRRLGERGRTERSELYALLDEALVCHLSVVVDGAPFVVPTGFGRDGDTLYVHGNSGALSLRSGDGLPVCVAVTLLDGVVYARSVFHNSMNYRAAIIHGTARRLDGDEKLHALHVITDHLAPGNWDSARLPTKKELAQTSVLALDLYEASVKVRAAGPKDDPEDLVRDTWAGVLPVRQVFGRPEPSQDLPPDMPVPAYVENR
jgi:uncharacterized protein